MKKKVTWTGLEPRTTPSDYSPQVIEDARLNHWATRAPDTELYLSNFNLFLHFLFILTFSEYFHERISSAKWLFGLRVFSAERFTDELQGTMMFVAHRCCWSWEKSMVWGFFNVLKKDKRPKKGHLIEWALASSLYFSWNFLFSSCAEGIARRTQQIFISVFCFT